MVEQEEDLLLLEDGAGNPGGKGNTENNNGATGTGGLLIIYTNSLINNGTIESKGSDGGALTGVSGGASGGGSINIFYKTLFEGNKPIATGGLAKKGGGGSNTMIAGGEGSVCIGSIATGKYIEDK